MPFFSYRPHFSDFPFLFPHFPYLCYVKCHISPFPYKKHTFFYSVHTFKPIPPVPPRSPPLLRLSICILGYFIITGVLWRKVEPETLKYAHDLKDTFSPS